MNIVSLSQWQFAITSIYHFFFVPLTLGLSVLLAVMETIYVRTGNELYKRMTKFWGKLFVINFAMGVVTGIVQEFQFGMNWSEYSRFIGDIFGAPLAIEALLAFFLESTFLGLWIFGWEKLTKGMHLAAICLVAFASNLSALWILIANSFMQHPVGYRIVEDTGRAVMTDFFALLQNYYVWGQFPHTVFSGFTTGAFFVIGISAYHLIRKNEIDFFHQSFKISSFFGLISIFLVIVIGDVQAKRMIQTQPMKMAAAEALMENENPASLSIFTITNEKTLENLVDIRAPFLLSFLSYSRFDGEVQGIHTLQEKYNQLYYDRYGHANYVPPIFICYWTFRIMVGAGFLLFFVSIYSIYLVIKNKPIPNKKIPYLNISIGDIYPFVLFLPYLATTTGWMLTEMGRQPWIVVGEMKTIEAVSPNLDPSLVLVSLVTFILVYGILMIADVYLLVKYAKKGPLTTPLNPAEL